MDNQIMTCRQRLDLENGLADDIVDGADLRTLARWAHDALTSSYSTLSDAELLAMVRDHAPYLLEETDDAAGEAEGS
jgi:hypothetical protein